jgi:hypothetical protein
MSKKLERAFRGRPLTPEEVAADAATRRKLEQEFPPVDSLSADSLAADSQLSSLSELLRRSIRESKKSIEEIASDAGVEPALIVKFLSRERDIRLATADRLAHSLGMKLPVD